LPRILTSSPPEGVVLDPFCGTGRALEVASVSATLNHLERLTAAGVNWRSFTEEYLDSCGIFRDAVLSILATVAKQERVRRSERAAAAIARLRRQGRTEHLGRPQKVIDREKVRRLHEEGLSLRQIGAKMRISAATAQRILRAA
jgi:DNA invertase Pin-like site-specific DNA recombinase